jgi:dethiobiotin synthetase
VTTVVLVSGTGTDVGKTWMGAAVLADLRARGLSLAARKPVQSYAPDSVPGVTDAGVLAAVTGEAIHDVCPSWRWLPLAMAPPIAAEQLGQPRFSVADLAAETRWPAGTDVAWVETIGGPRSPLAADGDSAALAPFLRPDLVVLVAHAGLGTINAVRLSAVPFAGRRLLVVLNRYDGGDSIHRTNRDWLQRDGFDVVPGPVELAGRLAATGWLPVGGAGHLGG